MKLKYKYINIALIVFSCLIIPNGNIIANEDNAVLDSSSDTRKILDTVGFNKKAYDIIEGEDIIIENIQTKLYKTFKSNEEALKSISKENFIIFIKEKYQLSNLNANNWTIYYDTALNENELSSSDYDKIVCFFDIYENKEKNMEIKTAIRKINTKARITNESTLSYIKELLPYTSNQQGKNEITQPQPRAKGLSYVKLKAYADKWVYSYNPAFPNYSKVGDCMNFVSQIVNAGGRKENVYWGRGMKTFYNADKFAKYFGIRVRTNSLKNFSSRVKAGDVALLDYTGDGSYDHAGFVYDTGTYKKYGNKYYTDFKIAQHTPNWIAWASSSINNWENNKGYWAILTITQ